MVTGIPKEPKLFDLSDETFDPVAFFINLAIILPLHHPIGFGRNDGDRALTRKEGQYRIGVIGLI